MLFLCCGGIELAPPLPTRIQGDSLLSDLRYHGPSAPRSSGHDRGWGSPAGGPGSPSQSAQKSGAQYTWHALLIATNGLLSAICTDSSEDAAAPMDAKTAATGAAQNRRERGFAQRPQPIIFFIDRSRRARADLADPCRASVRSVSVDGSTQARHEGRFRAITPTGGKNRENRDS